MPVTNAFSNPFFLVLLIPAAIVGVFFAAFAFKMAFIEWQSRQVRPGGFEIKITEVKPTDSKPVQRRKDDHG